MSRIEQLIAELCPDGVEFKELSEVAVIGTGSSNGNEATVDGKYPLFVRSKIIKRIDAFEFDEEAIIIPGEGGIGEIFHYINGKYALHQRAYRIHVKVSEISTKFLCYYMMSNFKEFILQKAVNATVSSIRKPMIAKFSIPIPPLPIQQEIVRILDTFTDLDAELQAELEARKKQFNFYKEKQFNYCKDSVEWRPLGEVGKFQRGKRFVKNDIVSSGIPCIHYGELYTHYKTWTKKTKSYIEAGKAEKLRFAKPGDVIIVTAGETIEDIGNCVAWLGDTDVVIHDACFAYSHNFIPKFVSYYFQTDLFRSQIRRFISSGKISAVHASGLSKATIPIPPLAEQERIVSILDKFEALVNDELPAEIAARRKQYEYYREKLLTFEPLIS